MSRRPRSVRAVSRLLAPVLALGAVVAVVLAPSAPAAAADLSRFDPGYIVSDSVFYNSRSMTGPEIQRFLDQKGANCAAAADGTPCLKDFRSATTSRAADSRCTAAYEGAADESAATIIYKVAQACGINPQVLLVMLQKEQGLVTASRNSLTPQRYRSAMGFRCPDTAPCDPAYAGFANQVYSAASQLRAYANSPASYNHRAGRVNYVRFHPNVACGSSPVAIVNQATASLYNYTPYQPNAAALAAGSGTGDACSTYGNRNFFMFFSDWFGSTIDPFDAPTGSVDAVRASPAGITVEGWALDRDTTAPIPVHVYVDGVGYVAMADLPSPLVEAAFPGAGSRHAFSVTVPAGSGAHTVCVYAINDRTGPNGNLGCTAITVGPWDPAGNVDTVRASEGWLTASGWAFDWDSKEPVVVHAYVDGVRHIVLADDPSPAVEAAFRGAGANRAFTLRVPVGSGTHEACFYALNVGGGSTLAMGCWTVTMGGSAPAGLIDAAVPGAGGVTVSGWAFDWDVTGPVPVHVYVGTTGAATTADLPSPLVERAFPGAGTHRAYRVKVAAPPGVHQVCAYALNLPSGPAALLGCRVATVAPESPAGSLDAVTPGPGSVSVSGWAFDWDSPGPLPVHVYVDGQGYALTADRPSPAVEAAFPGAGTDRGFSAMLPAAAGTRQVCVYALNVGGGSTSLLGCRTVTVG